MENKIIEYLNTINTLRYEKININFLETNIDSYSLQIDERENVIKTYTDGQQLLEKEIYLFKRSSYSAIEAIENTKFYNTFKEELREKTLNGALPDITGIQDIEVVSEAYIVEEAKTEAIYKIDLKIKYLK